MTEPPYERHPLDVDPAEVETSLPKTTYTGRDITTAYAPLLNASKYVLIVSASVVFLSGVAASNAQPNSSMESIAGLINRLSVMVLLCGFIMLLFAYRLPHLASPAIGTQNRSERLNLTGYHWLLLLNGLLLVILWGAILVTPNNYFGVLFLFINSLMVMAAGLLVTMLVFNAGWLRAYAIGTLIGIAPVLVWSMSSMAFMPMWGGWQLTLTTGVLVSLSPLTGVVCASYVVALTKVFGMPTASIVNLPPPKVPLADQANIRYEENL